MRGTLDDIALFLSTCFLPEFFDGTAKSLLLAKLPQELPTEVDCRYISTHCSITKLTGVLDRGTFSGEWSTG